MDLNIAQTDNTTGSVNIKTSGADADLNLNSNVSAADITLSSVSDPEFSRNSQQQRQCVFTGQQCFREQYQYGFFILNNW